MKNYSLFVALILAVLLGSCAMTQLNREVKELETYGTIAGRVEEMQDNHPVILVLWPESSDADQFGTYWILSEEGTFDASIPPGRYYLLAFQDVNHDSVFQDDEPYGILERPGIIDTAEASRFDDLVISLGEYSSSFVPEAIHERQTNNEARHFEWRRNFNRNKVDLSEERYGPEAASQGYWTPLSFSLTYGMTVGFLEEYDPDRLPVLFVHGAKGYPQEFSALIENLDTSRYQAWIVSYPSGARLHRIAYVLDQILQELHIKIDFEELIIVAHSMGGLVTRQMLTAEPGPAEIYKVPLYITISTPWNGHEASADGVRMSPAIVPSWYDMVPDNQLITGMFEKDINDVTVHHLFFSFSGKKVTSENADGSVTIVSQLHMPAQDQAKNITGIDNGHVGILSDEEMIQRFNDVLDQKAKIVH